MEAALADAVLRRPNGLARDQPDHIRERHPDECALFLGSRSADTQLAPVAIKAGRILLEAAPVELDLDKVQEDLLAVR